MRKILISNVTVNLAVFSVIVFIFFRCFWIASVIRDSNVQFLLLTVLAFMLWFVCTGFRIKLYKMDIGLIAYIGMVAADALFRTAHQAEALEYAVMLVIFFAFKLMLQRDFASVRKCSKWLYISALIIAVSIVLQAVVPSVVIALRKLLMSASAYNAATKLAGGNYYTGFDAHPASAVWICAIFMAFCIARLYNGQRFNLKMFFLIAVGVLATMFTKKRSVLLAMIIAVYFLYFLFSRQNSTRLIRLILISLALLLVAYIAYKTVPQVQFMVDKTLSDRALSGREDLWDVMIPMFQSAPMFGVGGGTLHSIYGYGGHNVYLQVLAEHGIIGMLLFVGAFVYPMVRTALATRKYLKTNRGTKCAVWLVAAVFMQIVFLIYCISGNPLYDYIFIGTELICLAIAQTVLQRKTNNEVEYEKAISDYPRLSGGNLY